MATPVTRRVLLTGATGLLGRRVVDAWPADGPDLVPVDSKDVDLLSPRETAALLGRVQPTDVVHLAWAASGTPGYRTSQANAAWLSATLGLRDVARARGARCWFTGTIVDDVPPGEERGADTYSLSKTALRRLLAPEIDRGEVGWLRPCYVVDEEWYRPALVAASLDAARSGRPVCLRTPSDVHDFVHASDVGTAVVVAVTQELMGVLEMGSGRARTVVQLVEALGASWTPSEDVEGRVSRHSARPAAIAWLTDRGWLPTRTRQLFGDDEDLAADRPVTSAAPSTVRAGEEG